MNRLKKMSVLETLTIRQYKWTGLPQYVSVKEEVTFWFVIRYPQFWLTENSLKLANYVKMPKRLQHQFTSVKLSSLCIAFNVC